MFLLRQERTKSHCSLASSAGRHVFVGILYRLSLCCGICLCFVEFHSGKMSLGDSISFTTNIHLRHIDGQHTAEILTEEMTFKLKPWPMSFL